jgi:hypothetical protein
MIKYLLKCSSRHEFESWFSNSKEYEKLKKNKLIECIFCNSTEVEKTIMSPSIVGEKNKIKNIFSEKQFTKDRKNLQQIQTFIEKNFEFVGEKFPREIREIFYDNKKNKNIYGTVTAEEREELEEEGIKLASIPWTKDKEN